MGVPFRPRVLDSHPVFDPNQSLFVGLKKLIQDSSFKAVQINGYNVTKIYYLPIQLINPLQGKG
jgi:hypothetical protein